MEYENTFNSVMFPAWAWCEPASVVLALSLLIVLMFAPFGSTAML